jgi:hypothetical protein
VSLFDDPGQPGTPPRSLKALQCGEIAPKQPPRWHLRRLPVCNRPHWHTGPHQEIRRQDFAVLHEWETSR